jgi:hypothetical protein
MTVFTWCVEAQDTAECLSVCPTTPDWRALVAQVCKVWVNRYKTSVMHNKGRLHQRWLV